MSDRDQPRESRPTSVVGGAPLPLGARGPSSLGVGGSSATPIHRPLRLTDAWRLGPSEVVALVGAGGKSSLMEALAREYEAEGASVLLTTTTKVRPPRRGERSLVLAGTLQELVSEVSRRIAAAEGRSPAPLLGRRLLPEDKVEGIPPEWICALRDVQGVDAVIVEADGAAGRSLKAPALWEPVVPSCASLVVAVAGLDAQGAPLDDAHVHRAELAARILGVEQGTPVPSRSLLDLSLLAYLERVPAGARFLVFLNKSDLTPPAPGLVEACGEAPVAVWAGSARAAAGGDGTETAAGGATTGPRCLREADPRPAAIVLAAGRASRLGGQKLLAPLVGDTVLGRVLAVVRSRLDCFAQVVVVGGTGSEDVSAVTGGLLLVLNPDPGAGQSSSLVVGIEALDRTTDILVLLGDQPFVTVDTLDRLLAVWERSPRAVAAALLPEGRSRVGPPVLLHRSLVPQLRELRGDQGARALLERYREGLVGVPGTALEGLDVDTPDALARARQAVEAAEESRGGSEGSPNPVGPDGASGLRGPGDRPNGPEDRRR